MEKSLEKNNYYDGIENIINLETATFCSKCTNKYIQTTMNGKVYFGKKYTKFYSKIEAFVEELAKDYKIPCASCLFVWVL